MISNGLDWNAFQGETDSVVCVLALILNAERATPFFMVQAVKNGAWELGRLGKPVVLEKFVGGFSPGLLVVSSSGILP